MIKSPRRHRRVPVGLAALAVAAVLLPWTSHALSTNDLKCVEASGLRHSTNLYNHPLHNTGAGAVKIGELFDQDFPYEVVEGGFTNIYYTNYSVGSSFIIIFDLLQVPPAIYSNCSFQIRFAFANNSYLYDTTLDAENVGKDLDLYGLGFGPSASDPSLFPTNVVFYDGDAEAFGVKLIDNFYTNGTPSANIDFVNGFDNTDGFNDRRAYNVDKLREFMQTRPEGPEGRYVFFRVNYDDPFVANYIVAVGNSNFNLKNNIGALLGLSYEPTIAYITNFTAPPAPISAGGSATLSWVVDPGVTNLTITPDVGDVTDRTVGGVGSVEVTPLNDTIYQLAAEKDGFTVYSQAEVVVNLPREEAFLDLWDAAITNFNALELPYPNNWYSIKSNLATGEIVTYITNSSPNGMPALQFNGFAGLVSQTNPVSGLSEFSVVAVFKADTNFPPSNPLPPPTEDSWTYASGIVDANVTTISADWGLSLQSNGAAVFGAGTPNFAVTSDLNLLDGKYHVAIARFGAGKMSLHIDTNAPVVRTGAPRQPRNPSDPVAFGRLQFSDGVSSIDPFFRGDLAEVRFYADTMSDTDINWIVAELSDKYGLGFAPPSPEPNEILSAVPVPGGLELTFESVGGLSYTVETRVKVNTGSWSSVTNVPATGATTTVTLPAPASGEAFYRIVFP